MLSAPGPAATDRAGVCGAGASGSEGFAGVPQAVVLLEQAAVQVCALASHAPKDPRAPQNLIPLGGLERQLRHKLGDSLLVRRGIARALCAMV